MTHVPRTARLPRTEISSGTLRSVIEYGLPLPFVKVSKIMSVGCYSYRPVIICMMHKSNTPLTIDNLQTMTRLQTGVHPSFLQFKCRSSVVSCPLNGTLDITLSVFQLITFRNFSQEVRRKGLPSPNYSYTSLSPTADIRYFIQAR